MESAAAELAPPDARELGSAGGQRAPRQAVRWERFLPRRSLRVLLVEYDDSTRHIVAALLRKCSYHVAAVADGLKAWEVLKERHYSFDLVLTEVAMPSLSGIGLLTKIMSSEECKNIPVIMMSSHDSIGVVYKCMLKGAVDFLVKPVRKNELRNLWQHVWRRHCTSSYANASDNNAASNHISGNAGERSKTGENSEDATDAQSSGSEPDAEIESVRKPLEPNPAEQWSISKEAKAKSEQPVDGMTKTANALRIDKLGKREVESMETGIKVVLPVQEGSLAEKSKDQNDLCNIHPYRNGVEDQVFWRSEAGRDVEPGSHHKNDNPGEPLQSMDYSVKPISNGQCSYALSEENAPNNQALSAASELPHAKNGSNFSSLAPLELCFKKPEKNGCISVEFKERNVLIRSDASAFSRYGEKRIHPSQKSVPSASCIRTRECDDKCQSSAHTHGVDNDKCTSLPTQELFLPHNHKERGASINIQISSGGNKEAGVVSSVTQQEDGIGNHSSTGEASILHQPGVGFISFPIPVRAVPYQSFSAGYGAILHPMFHPGASLTQHCSDAADIPKHQIACDESGQQDYHISSSIQSFNFQPYKDHHQSYHMRQPNGIEAGGPSAFSCSPAEPANQNASCIKDTLNGIGSNGSGETTDAAGNTGTTLESGNESGVQNCNREAVDSDRTRREAALIKFRLKRKDRCFEKRVRYHSRKKLAEQRPRVKGQFVRQKVLDSTMENEADE